MEVEGGASGPGPTGEDRTSNLLGSLHSIKDKVGPCQISLEYSGLNTSNALISLHKKVDFEFKIFDTFV